MSIRFWKRNRKRIPINVCTLKVKRKCVVKLFYGPSLDTHWHVMFFNFSFIDFYGMSRFGHTFGPVDCQRTILRCFILLCPVKRTCAFYDIFSKTKPILSPLHGPITWQKCEQVRLNVFWVGGNPSPTWLTTNQPSGVTIWMKKGIDVCGMYPSPAVNVVPICVCAFLRFNKTTATGVKTIWLIFFMREWWFYFISGLLDKQAEIYM